MYEVDDTAVDDTAVVEALKLERDLAMTAYRGLNRCG
jgi:hypothetical protein